MNYTTTAYESRKNSVDVGASEAKFSLDFATAAFSAGYTAGPGRRSSIQQPLHVQVRIEQNGHSELAHCCLAYLLAHENAHHPEEQKAYLACLRRIREGAKDIALAADELAAQFFRHLRETGEVETMRATAFYRLTDALHGEFTREIDRSPYRQNIMPRPINNQLSDHEVVHGLSGCVALFNEAERLLKEQKAAAPATCAYPAESGGMKAGNKTDIDTKAFILDLAKLFELVIQRKPTAHYSASDAKSPFMRFVDKVFDEIRTQRNSIVGERVETSFDQKAYAAPSTSTVRAILRRTTDSSSQESISPDF
jgi:hypothetical protein